MNITRHVVGQPTMRMVRQYLVQNSIYFIAGQSSIWVPSRREKYIDVARSKEWPDIEGELVPMTAGEAARTELRRAFPTLKKIGWRKPEIVLMDWRPPMFYLKPFVADYSGCYVDLKGAYHQIYKKLWLDVKYPKGFGTLRLAGIAHRLENWKQARNALIGVCIGRTAIGIKGSARKKIQTQNPFLSPPLWATVQTILHELAFLALICGATYVATDGYLFPDGQNHKLFTDTLDIWGYQYRKFDAPIEVRGWGSYSVFGHKQTTPYKLGQTGGQTPIDNIQILDDTSPTQFCEWMYKHVERYYDEPE